MTGRWLPVTIRIVAGFAGGYVLSAVVAVGLAKVLPMARLDAVLTGAMIGFVVYVVAIIWAFAARTALRASLGVWLPCLVVSGVTQVLR